MSLGKVITDTTTYELVDRKHWIVLWEIDEGQIERDTGTEDALRRRYDQDEWWGPSMGQPGAAVLQDFAKLVKGRVVLEPQPKSTRELTY